MKRFDFNKNFLETNDFSKVMFKKGNSTKHLSIGATRLLRKIYKKPVSFKLDKYVMQNVPHSINT